MIASGKKLPTRWGEDNNVSWTYEVSGESWSSPIVWDNRVFISSASLVKAVPDNNGEPDTSQQGQEERSSLKDFYRWELTCLDLATGEELWKKVAFKGNPRIKKHPAHNYAGESPLTDGKRVYVYFGMTGLFCYDMKGELLWKKDLGVYKTLNDWGTGASPALYKNRLYIQVDNEEQSFLVALDTKTGEVVWRADRDENTNYSTPVIWKNRIRTELVAGGKKARAYDPETGELLWELAVGGYYNIPSPASNRDFLYLGNEGRGDTPGTLLAIKAGAEGDITPVEGELKSSGVEWSLPDAPLGRPSPLLYNGLLYLVTTKGGQITCLDAKTGSFVYQEKIENCAACWASPWLADGKIYVLDEKGVTTVIKAGKQFEQLAQYKLDDKFWASVAMTKNTYLFKGTKKLYCIKN